MRVFRTISADDNPNVLLTMDELLTRIDPGGEHRFACDCREVLALAREGPVDVAFLDVEMPGPNGLETARRLMELYPEVNIVFITGYSEYAMPAFDLFASGYLLKPITEDKLRRALAHLRCRPEGSVRRLKVKCFGSFEVLCDGLPVHFDRSRTMSLFAFLVDRNGEPCGKQTIIDTLWPEQADNAAFAAQLRVFLSDLHSTLVHKGVGDVVLRRNGMVSVNRSQIDCDYFRFLDGDYSAREQFNGEYMNQYSFGEVTLARLRKMKRQVWSQHPPQTPQTLF